MARLDQEKYDALKSHNVRTQDICAVLDWTPNEKNAVTHLVTQKLNDKGLTPDDKIQNTDQIAKADQIIKELKTGLDHQELFHRALDKGEDEQQVNLALMKLIQRVHNDRKRKTKKLTLKPEQSAPSPSLCRETLPEASNTLEIGSLYPNRSLPRSLSPMEGGRNPSEQSTGVYITVNDDDHLYFVVPSALTPKGCDITDRKSWSLACLKENMVPRLRSAGYSRIRWENIRTLRGKDWVYVDCQDVFTDMCKKETCLRISGLEADKNLPPASQHTDDYVASDDIHAPNKGLGNDDSQKMKRKEAPDESSQNARNDSGVPPENSTSTPPARKRPKTTHDPEKAAREHAEREKERQKEAELKKEMEREAEREKKRQEEAEREKEIEREAEREKKRQEEAEREKEIEREAEREKKRQEEAEREKEMEREAEREKKRQEEAEREEEIERRALRRFQEMKDEHDKKVREGSTQDKAEFGELASEKAEPDMSKSGEPEREMSENPKPESEKPESEKPESEKPESEKSESEKPESEKPESKDDERLKWRNLGMESELESEYESEGLSFNNMDVDVPPNPDAERLEELFKYRPDNIPSWEETGQDIPIGEEDRKLSYDPNQEFDNTDEDEEDPENEGMNVNIEDTAEEIELKRVLRAQAELAKVLEQYDEQTVAEMYRFFKHDPQKNSLHPDHRIVIEGISTPLQHHQAYGAYWCLIQEGRELGGGIIADEPGFGKTLMMFAICLCGAEVARAWQEVLEARTNGRYNQHLASSDVTPQAPDAQCPSNEPYAICCPCVERNPSSRMNPNLGVNIIMVPPTLVLPTLNEWYRHMKVGNEKKMTLWVQQTLPRTKGQRYIRLGTGSNAARIDFSELRAQGQDIQFVRTHPDSAEISRYVILCSAPSWTGYVQKYNLHTLRFGRYFRDEFHQEPGMGVQWMRYLQALNKYVAEWGRPHGWVASGTPYEKGPSHLMGVMDLLLHRRNLEEHEFWSKYTPERLHDLQTRLNEFVSTKSGNTREREENRQRNLDATQHWSALLKRLVIRRGRDSRWAGVQIIKNPRRKHRLVICQPTPRMREMGNRALRTSALANAQTAKDVKSSHFYNVVRAAASFPWVTEPEFQRHLFEGKTLNITLASGMKKLGLFDDRTIWDKKKNPYLKYLPQLVRFSPKMKSFKAIIKNKGVDYRKDPAKVIVFCFTNSSALICYLFLMVKMKIQTVWYHSHLSSSERDIKIKEFQEDPKVQAFVSTGRVGGTGITLTKAMRMILFEPESDSGLVRQEFGRMERQGNKNWHGIWSYELINDGAPAEKEAKARREGKSKIAEAAAQAMLDIAQGKAKEDDDKEDDGDDDLNSSITKAHEGRRKRPDLVDMTRTD